MHILKHRQLFWMDQKLQAAIRETLALIGYVDPLKGWGIRVLSIDGGGTRYRLSTTTGTVISLCVCGCA